MSSNPVYLAPKREQTGNEINDVQMPSTRRQSDQADAQDVVDESQCPIVAAACAVSARGDHCKPLEKRYVLLAHQATKVPRYPESS